MTNKKSSNEASEEVKELSDPASQIVLTAESDEGPALSELAKCYVMNKSHQLKSRLAYINDMTLYVTYLSENGDQLIVALSVELDKSHVMTDNPRYINILTSKISSVTGG